MYSSTLDALYAISGALGGALVSARTRGRLAKFAARYPDLGQTQYLECRLGEGKDDQVDLLISAASRFERTSLGRELSIRPGEDPLLWPLQRFVAAWMSPASVLYRNVPVAWLEFDHMESDDDPLANLGVCLAPAYIDPFASLPAQRSAEMLDTILASLQAVSRAPARAADRTAFQRCLDKLPDDARWIHLSIMTARHPVELKLYGTFAPAAVLPYLGAVGWQGDQAAVARLLERYCPSERTGDVVYVDLPVTGMFDRATAGLGIVFPQQHLRTARETDPSRRPLLHQLVTDRLCTPAQAKALALWPGTVANALPRTAADQEPWQLRRWFDIKLAWRAGRPLLAKAYLGFVVTSAGEAETPAPSRRVAASTRPVSRPSSVS